MCYYLLVQNYEQRIVIWKVMADIEKQRES